MKWMMIVVIINLMGCALFQKTNRLSSVNGKETSTQTYLDKVDVKTASKETHNYTWWNDSSVYQYQIIREHVDETKQERLNSAEKALERNKTVEKERTPVKIWMYAGITILILGLLWIIKKVIIFRHSNAKRH